MAILIDHPRWPAHGTLWGHLVSDASLAELHHFAARTGIPPRGFDHDHYDVPASRHAAMVDAGALPVTSGELVRRLLAAGLRVPAKDRTPSRAAATAEARDRFRALLPSSGVMGEALLECWSTPHRHYHDPRHLVHCLAALDLLTDGSTPRPVALAAWFHDAVHEGRPGEDEEASAPLAEEWLRDVVGPAEAAEVARLVRVTASHDPSGDDEGGALLSDADLSILAVVQGRYHVYLRDVRLDYAHVADADFRAGRRRVVASLLAREPLSTRDVYSSAASWAVPGRTKAVCSSVIIDSFGSSGHSAHDEYGPALADHVGGEIAAGLPGIPSNILTNRLRSLESAGVVERSLPEDGSRGVVYRLTEYGRDLEPIVLALGAWGARRMASPDPEEVVTEDFLSAALLAEGAIEAVGDPALITRFTDSFRMPLDVGL